MPFYLFSHNSHIISIRDIFVIVLAEKRFAENFYEIVNAQKPFFVVIQDKQLIST